MRVTKLLGKIDTCPVLLREEGTPLSHAIYTRGPISACMEISNMEAMRKRNCFGDLRHCHVSNLYVEEDRLLVITWHWGK